MVGALMLLAAGFAFSLLMVPFLRRRDHRSSALWFLAGHGPGRRNRSWGDLPDGSNGNDGTDGGGG